METWLKLDARNIGSQRATEWRFSCSQLQGGLVNHLQNKFGADILVAKYPCLIKASIPMFFLV